jgi:hypothetical protein
VAEHILRNGAFTDYGFSLIVMPPRRETPWTLNLPTSWDALRLYFEERGYYSGAVRQDSTSAFFSRSLEAWTILTQHQSSVGGL